MRKIAAVIILATLAAWVIPSSAHRCHPNAGCGYGGGYTPK
jgi:hypothetical protein